MKQKQTKKDIADTTTAAGRIEEIALRIDKSLRAGVAEENNSVRRAMGIGKDLIELKAAAKDAKQKFGEVVATRFTFSKQWRSRVMKLAERRDDVERLLSEDATAFHCRSVDGMYKALTANAGNKKGDGEREKLPSRKDLEAEIASLKEQLDEAESEIEELRHALKKVEPDHKLLRLEKSSSTGLLSGKHSDTAHAGIA